jgi:hypothetical protein
MKTTISSILIALGLVATSGTSALADYYKGTFKITEIDKKGINLEVKKGDIVEVEFAYIPNLEAYQIFEIKPNRPEYFLANGNNMIRKVSLESFNNFKDTSGENIASTQDSHSIFNVIDVPGIRLTHNEVFSDQEIGVKKSAFVSLETDVFTHDKATPVDLTLVNGYWSDSSQLVLTVEDNSGKKPKYTKVKGTLISVDCVEGSCYKTPIEPEMITPLADELPKPIDEETPILYENLLQDELHLDIAMSNH